MNREIINAVHESDLDELLEAVILLIESSIESNNLEDQLRQIIRELRIAFKDLKPFTRCLECNASIKLFAKAEISGQVPDYIWETNETFRKCPRCNRVYWPGSHTKRSMQRIEDLFNVVSHKENEGGGRVES